MGLRFDGCHVPSSLFLTTAPDRLCWRYEQLEHIIHAHRRRIIYDANPVL